MGIFACIHKMGAAAKNTALQRISSNIQETLLQERHDRQAQPETDTGENEVSTFLWQLKILPACTAQLSESTDCHCLSDEALLNPKEKYFVGGGKPWKDVWCITDLPHKKEPQNFKTTFIIKENTIFFLKKHWVLQHHNPAADLPYISSLTPHRVNYNLVLLTFWKWNYLPNTHMVTDHQMQAPKYNNITVSQYTYRATL